MIIRTLGSPNIELWSGGVVIMFICIIRYDLFMKLINMFHLCTLIMDFG